MENETVGARDVSKKGIGIFSPSNSLKALTRLATMAGFITETPPLDRQPQKTYFDDVETIVFNTPVIPLEAAKRASTSSWQETRQER
jgi:hypothetical protein